MNDNLLGLLKNLTSEQAAELTEQLKHVKESAPLLQQEKSFDHQLSARDINNVNGIQQIINQINIGPEQLAKMLGIKDSFEYNLSCPVIDVPPLAQRICHRETLVNAIVESFKEKTWCALQGDIACGKSQLAILVTKKMGTCKAWISLRNLESVQIAYILEQSLQIIGPTSSKMSSAQWYTEICSFLNPGDIIVLDDISLSSDIQVNTRLMLLVQACILRKVKLITISCKKIPVKYLQSFETEINIVDDFRLNEDDVRELFLAYNATDVTKQIILWCLAATKGHPALLNALARFFMSKKWNITLDRIIDILQGGYGEELTLEVDEVLNFEDAETRDLLYRLSLIDWPFDEGYIWRVSEVAPAVLRPKENFLSTIGLWIQQDQNSEYSISPLLTKFGKKYLSPELKKKVQFAIAQSILKKRTITPSDGLRAISNFYASGAISEAAHVLFQILVELNNHPADSYDLGFMCIWVDMELPKEIDYKMRVSLRLMQLLLLKKREKNLSYVLEDLVRLVEEAREIDLFLVGTCIMASITLILDDPAKALFFLGLALKGEAQGINYKQVLELDSDFGIEMMLWMATVKIKTCDDLAEWMAILEHMSNDQQKTALNSDLSLDGCMMVANAVWYAEDQKEIGEQRWEPVIEIIGKLAELGRKKNIEILWACAVRAQAIVYAEYLKDVDRAVNLVIEKIKDASDDTKVQFVLCEAIGREYALAKRHKEAVPWFEEAFSKPFDGFEHERLYAALIASKNLGQIDVGLGVHYAELSVKLAKAIPIESPLYHVKVLGELAIAQWLHGDLSGAFYPLQEAGNLLLRSKMETEEWKSLFVLFVHITGFFAHLTSTGKPPDKISNGENYVEPYRGMMFSEHPDMHTLYSFQDWIMPIHLGQMANGLDIHKYDSYWMLRGFELYQSVGDKSKNLVLLFQTMPYLISDKKFATAIQLYIEATIWTIAWLKIKGNLREMLNADFNVESVLGDKPSNEWNTVEERVVSLSIFPIVVYLNSERLNSNTSVIQYTQDILTVCKKIKRNASKPLLWAQVEEIIRKIFIENVTVLDLMSYSKQVKQESLKAMCYHGVGLVGTLKEAVESQKAILLYIEGFKGLAEYKKIMIPFYVRYWEVMFEKQRSQFNMPQIFESKFKEVVVGPWDTIISNLIKLADQHV